MARERAAGPITLDVLYGALMTIADGIDEQREQWQEAVSNLTERMELRDERSRAQDDEIIRLRKRQHDFANQLTTFIARVEALEQGTWDREQKTDPAVPHPHGAPDG